jgi:hypothetical protein
VIGVSPEQRSFDRPITTEGQLFVEGRVPEMFFREMIIACGLESRIEARTFGDINKNNLETWLELFCQKATFKEKVKRLGIVRDAESSTADAAFRSVQAALKTAGLHVPEWINTLTGTPLSIGVFVLPDCQNAGMLENLCLTAIAEIEGTASTRVLPCIDAFFNCLNTQGRSPDNPVKARLAGFALACDVIDPQLGRAAQQGVIPWAARAFEPLKVFLRAVAGEG